ncbi:hypothetical protein ABPG75_004903 [Micractinium tetrahymenae]
MPSLEVSSLLVAALACGPLQRLEIHWPQSRLSLAPLTPLTALQELSLSANEVFLPQGRLPAATLTSLSLSGLPEAQHLPCQVAELTQLRHLELFGANPQSWERLSRLAGSLRSLSLAFCERLPDCAALGLGGLTSLALEDPDCEEEELEAMLAAQPRLQRLRLHFAFVIPHFPAAQLAELSELTSLCWDGRPGLPGRGPEPSRCLEAPRWLACSGCRCRCRWWSAAWACWLQPLD